MKIRILYEDNHLLVVEKPVNILSQADDTGDADMLNLLKRDIKERYNKPGEVFLGLVHRLDRPVGGVMVFARTSKAASRLSDQIRQKVFKKTYQAVLHGVPTQRKGRLVHSLLKDPVSNIVKAVREGTPGAKEAILEYEVLAEKNGLSLVKIDLHTGRPHQIRVQFSTLGHPLYGDQKYGPEVNQPGQQIALWAVEVRCTHPTKQEELKLECPPPLTYPWDIFQPK